MKYEFKGTPAPWEFIGNPGKHFDPVIYSVKTRGQLNKEGRNYKADEAEVDNICIAAFKTWQADIPQEEHQANGCLIAAAPEMLQMLIRVNNEYVENLPEDHRDYRLVMDIRKLLNKALNIQP